MNHHILAIDTSGPACELAIISCDTEQRTKVVHREHHGIREHSEKLLQIVSILCVDATINKKDLSAVSFAQGPGAFTGLRVACGVSQGLAFALSIPVLPIPSHRVIIHELMAPIGSVCVVVTNANMGEVYLSAYRRVGDGKNIDGVWLSVSNTYLLAATEVAKAVSVLAEQFALDVSQILCIGDAYDAYYEDLCSLNFISQASRLSVITLARIALQDFLDKKNICHAEDAAPLYIRDKVAFTTQERSQGLIGNPTSSFSDFY